jgi:glycosyltransferase involved in cell wall biosynthesis
VPAVSILMPVRDAECWLGEALDSIAAQTLDDWELLAVDDGSRDASRRTLEAAARADRRIRVLETVAGARGIVPALNTGLTAARARYLARMDADDVAHPERLRRQLRALDAEPTWFGVSCRVRALPTGALRDGMRRYLAWQNSLLDPEELARDRFVESPLVHPSVMLRTEVLRGRLGGWHDTAWPEDWDLFQRAFEQHLRIARVPEVLMSWRLHADQATRKSPRYSEESFLAARAHYLARWLERRTHGRPLWLLGAGAAGKRLARALADRGAEPAGFVDVDPRKIGGRVRHGERAWPIIAMTEMFAARPRPFAVSTVGRRGGREDVRALLTGEGWRESTDFVVAA